MDLSQTRREMMFINLLESVHPLEAEILVLVKDKKLTESYKITKEISCRSLSQILNGDNRKR